MKTMKLTRVEAFAEGERLDVFLATRLPGMSRSAIQRLIDEGLVTLNGQTLKKNHRVSEGETYEVFLTEPEAVETVAEDISLEVLYEDEDLIVVNKPKGMVVHPAPGHSGGTLVNALLHHCGENLSTIGGEDRPGIVHRIDKDTSGLILAAKNDRAHKALAAQLKDRSLSRVYEALVIGNVKTDAGTVDAPIGRHPIERKKMAVTANSSRNAVTHYEVIARLRGVTHLRCRLETGRTHQIRVHMASLGHPVLGDTVYGRRKPVPGLDGQCLHAKELSFTHPGTGEKVTVSCELPAYFVKLLGKYAAE
ncbi:MAG: RluA family pseudouridine synthase [Clostridiales bacterium]|jgi:23S rRNA pseudouridine1911/1915/1917 synthase|nr:RluA family pseudouridine synthase [Clostridiales bacterium]